MGFQSGHAMHIFWDPDSIAFTLPLIGYPITWYGLLFAFGFFLGHRLLILLFTRFLSLYPSFTSGDVIDWQEIARDRTAMGRRLFSGLSASQKEAVAKGTLSAKEGEELLQLLHRFLDVENLEKDAKRGTFRFVERCAGEKVARRLKNRLALESLLHRAFCPLAKRASILADRLVAYMVLSTVIGARLGEVIFYERAIDYLLHPFAILEVWKGGLASHGGVIGVFTGLFLFHLRMRNAYPILTFRRLCDLIALPALCPCISIRLGNFINQEVLGKFTDLPWAIAFCHPIDGSAPLPRHPAQLYEMIAYLAIFLFFFPRFAKWIFPVGHIGGTLLIAVFASRICLEFFKEEQSYWISGEITMGQILSIPMILIGIALLVRKKSGDGSSAGYRSSFRKRGENPGKATI